MAKRVGVDKWLFGVTVLLVFIGLLMVFSASAVMAQDRYGSPYTFVRSQAVSAVLGLIAMIVVMRIDHRRFNRPIVVFPAVAITTLLLLGVFLLRDSHNTHRWIRFAGAFSFQPSEIAKPVLVLFLAWFLQDKLQNIRDWRNTLMPAALPSLLFILLILKEPDLGTALVCAAVTALLFYLAGAETKYFGYAILAAAPVLYVLLFRVPLRWAPAASVGSALWKAGRSFFTCRNRIPTSSLPTSPRNSASLARWRSLLSSLPLGIAGCGRRASRKMSSHASSPLALRRPSSSRLSSISA